MTKKLSSMFCQAVRGKIILGWVTQAMYPYSAMVTLPKLSSLPSLGMVTQPGYGYPALVWLPSLGMVTQAGKSYPVWVK